MHILRATSLFHLPSDANGFLPFKAVSVVYETALNINATSESETMIPLQYTRQAVRESNVC